MSDLHLVIGGGTVGGRLGSLLASKGKRVLVITRTTNHAAGAGVEYRSGDATSVEQLLARAPEAKVVYNCANPPYNKWGTEWPKLSSAVNEYVVRVGADLVICSNLYGYGPHAGVLTEDLPLKATWTNGIARARAWEEAKKLNDSGKLRATEVRGSDYICANEQSRMGDRVVPNLLRGKPVQLLGALDQPHTWTDPDDVAMLMMKLAEDDRSWGKPWHVPSNPPKTQREVVADIAQELGVSGYKVSAVGKAMEGILGLFNPLIRELNKGAYQFDRPFVVSSESAQTTFGLAPKAWEQIIQDLVQPYLTSSNANGEKARMRLAVFGGTGLTGSLVIQLGLEKGNQVRALTRNPDQFPIKHPNLEVVQGSALSVADVETALAGCDAVIHCLGIGGKGDSGSTTLISDSVKVVVEQMEKSGIKRIVCMSNVGAGGSGSWLYLRIVLPVFLRWLQPIIEDKERMEQTLRASSVEWVSVRLPNIVSGPSKPIQTSADGRGIRNSITAASVARFLLAQTTEKQWLNQAPSISN